MRIIVGVDGSKGARTALEWALDEARVRKADVTLLTAWSPVVTAYFAAPAPFVDPAMMEEAAHQIQRNALDDVDATGVKVQTTVVTGGAAPALISESESADLVVVGTRGHGGFAGLLIGSVSQQVAEHAHCPVVIVPSHA